MPASPIAKSSSSWIQNPWVDTLFFSFGWVILFSLFVAFDPSQFRKPSRQLLLVTILMFNFLHRHLTFPLVYGDAQVFRNRKTAYLLLPLGFLLLTIALFYSKPLFAVVVVVSTLWTMYHTLMQKVGILRVYEKKSNYADPRLEKTLIFSWFAVLVFALAASPSARKHAAALSSAGKSFNQFFMFLGPWLQVFLMVATVFAVVCSGFYVWQEYRNRENFHWGKNLFLASILALYGVFFYDFLVGYAIFGFSHAIEYIAFVAIFTRRKYAAAPENSSWLATTLKRQKTAILVFFGLLLGIFFTWRHLNFYSLTLYIVGSSFLHFLYDGWIWKLRRPEVAAPLGFAPSSGQPQGLPLQI